MEALENWLRYKTTTFELLQADRTDWYFLDNLIQSTFAFEGSGDHLSFIANTIHTPLTSSGITKIFPSDLSAHSPC